MDVNPKPPPFTRHGTAEHRIEVSADEILEAIAEGRDVDVEYADINEELDLRKNTDNPTIKGDVAIRISEFRENVRFDWATFIGYVDFRGSIFIGDAYFIRCTFDNSVYFTNVIFAGDVTFNVSVFNGSEVFFDGTNFCGDAYFTGVTVKRPALFAFVDFRENTVFTGLWNLTLGKIDRIRWPVTRFEGFNTNRLMDISLNPYLKRYIDDEQWITSWRERGCWRKALFVFWELTSHCGRSFGLWLFWSFVLAVAFGFLYKGHINIGSVNNWYTPFYFSVVTFTTLGFGDVTPIDWLGQLWITLEVVCGYLMLGGLISIFANKFARRS